MADPRYFRESFVLDVVGVRAPPPEDERAVPAARPAAPPVALAVSTLFTRSTPISAYRGVTSSMRASPVVARRRMRHSRMPRSSSSSLPTPPLPRLPAPPPPPLVAKKSRPNSSTWDAHNDLILPPPPTTRGLPSLLPPALPLFAPPPRCAATTATTATPLAAFRVAGLDVHLCSPCVRMIVLPTPVKL